ncbi:MAG: RES domain-containing protein [Nitrospiria bacterium]
MAEPNQRFLSLLRNISLRALKGVYFRTVPEQAADFVLEDGPSYLFKNRYNVLNEFGALYFADREEVCRATLEKRGLLSSRRLPYVLISFDIEADGLLDLTDPDNLKVLKLQREDLIQTREKPTAYDIPQGLAKTAYNSGRILGLYVPDASETGNTLVLYPGRILSRQIVRIREKVLLK